MSIDNALFRHELAANSRGFARDHKIEVIFEGDGAKTNGGVIYLPQLNDQKALSEHEQRVMRGYVDHESAHIRHTKLTTMKQAHDEGGEYLGHLLNCLEDVRIDALVVKEFAGAAKNIRATASSTARLHLTPALKADLSLVKDVKRTAGALLTLVGRTRIGLGSPEVDETMELFDPGFRKWVDGYAARAIACKDTEEALDLARAMRDEIEAKEPPPPKGEPENAPEDTPPGEKGEGKGDGKGKGKGKGEAKPGKAKTPGDGEGEGGGEDEGEDEDEEGEGEGDEGDDDGQQGGGQGQGGDDGEDGEDEGEDDAQPNDWSPAGKGSGAGAGRPLEASLEGAMKEIVQEHTKRRGPQGPQPIALVSSTAKTIIDLHDLASVERAVGSERLIAKGLLNQQQSYAANYDRRRQAELSGVIGVMTREFERLMASSLNRDKLRSLEQGRIDPRRLSAAYLGARNVFWQRGERPEVDTAVEILLDASSSMMGPEAMMQELAMIAVGEALERAGVSFSVRAFTSSGMSEAERIKCDRIIKDLNKRGLQYGERYHSNGNYLVLHLKHHKHRMAQVRGIIGGVHRMAWGGTPLGDAMFEVWPHLAARPERRKVMLVMTDGTPDQSHVVSRAVKDMTAKGVECIGIGIGSSAVSALFPRHAVVGNVQDLTGETLRQLKHALLPDRRAGRKAA